MTTSRYLRDLLNKLAAEEERLLASDFLAPALRCGVVHVRIAGVVCRFKLESGFEGWGVFRPTGTARACLLRPATLAERRRYLQSFPLRRLILCHADQRNWLAWPAHQADPRFADMGLTSVRLVEEAQTFETIAARFDGVQCWFESVDPRADPAAAVYLRAALQKMTPPEQVRRSGLTAEQRTTYAVAYGLCREAERDRTEDRLRAALAHAGGQLTGYLERADGYRVEFHIEGRSHVSMVDKGDLTIQAAGICLSGEDRCFDLQSLVGVLREAYREE
ncbi:MAG TPA: hypothetical protein VH682_00790 [Gemmataceae bacterium]|jgi:hypothetical protein